jgi:hypothetical protein
VYGGERRDTGLVAATGTVCYELLRHREKPHLIDNMVCLTTG